MSGMSGETILSIIVVAIAGGAFAYISHLMFGKKGGGSDTLSDV